MPAKKQTKTPNTESKVVAITESEPVMNTASASDVKATKATKTTKPKATKTKKAATTETEQTQQVTETQQTVESTQPEQTETTEATTDKKSTRKAGRTLLVKAVGDNQLSAGMFDGFEGLTSKSETKSTNSYFLTFDTVSNAVNAYRKLRTDSPDCRVKYSYYRVFFTMNGLVDSTDYNQVKTELTEHVTKQTGANVLYCKLYRKESKYLGCGDFTIDTLDGMNMLLSKEGTLKEFTLGTSSVTGTFYRFNGKKDKTGTHDDTVEHHDH